MNKLSLVGLCGRSLFALSIVVSIVSSSHAVDFFWNVANGDFAVGANWNPPGPPDFLDRAFIDNGGTATYSASTGLRDVDTLEVGSGVGTSGTFSMTGGDLFSNVIRFGERGSATASVNNAILSAGSGSLFVGGHNNTGTGVLTVSGASSRVSSGDDIQFGSTGNGTLNMSGGVMKGVYTVVGKFGTGLWNHSAGVFDQDGGDIEIGDGGRPDQAGTPGPRIGTIDLSGGVIQGAGHFAIGNRSGTGVVDISGGALDMTGDPNGTGTIFVGRGMDWESMPGAGGPVELRVIGDDSIIVANGAFSMNPADVASSSTLIAEITGPAHSPIKVVGDAIIGNGAFKVDLTGYTPVGGEMWTILEAGADISAELTAIDALVSAGGYPALAHVAGSSVGTLMGPFESEDFSLAPLSAGLSWDVEYVDDKVVLKVIGAAGIDGDYNNNDSVDAADYVAWRNAGPTDTLPNDPTPGTVDASDYALWRANFGKGPAGAASLSNNVAAVPEPGAMMLLAMGLVIVCGVQRYR